MGSQNNTSDEEKSVEDLEVGDMVDLETDPLHEALREEVMAEYEYIEVYEIHNRGGYVEIGYESIGGLWIYPKGTKLKVRSS